MADLQFIAMATETIAAPYAGKERANHQNNPQHWKNDFHSVRLVD
jgi:hypothetical protein